MLTGVELSSTEIRQTLKQQGVLEFPVDQTTLVIKLANHSKQRGRYRCDVFARPIGFVA
ncbi:hypothetical protein QGP82_23325 [Leptothoe sp. LEGE 181152]|nr:hypothetical protein [Leptothoe sp. LEGE 181152]